MQHISIRKHLGCLGHNKYHKNMNSYYLARQEESERPSQRREFLRSIIGVRQVTEVIHPFIFLVNNLLVRQHVFQILCWEIPGTQQV